VEDESEAGFGEYVEAEIAASFCPFIGLFGEDGADEPDDLVAVGEDADAVRAAANLTAEALRKDCWTRSVPRARRGTA